MMLCFAVVWLFQIDMFAVLQIVASELWSYLSEKHSLHHQRTVELFHTLHQVTPNGNICEDVIGHDLISESEVSVGMIIIFAI